MSDQKDSKEPVDGGKTDIKEPVDGGKTDVKESVDRVKIEPKSGGGIAAGGGTYFEEDDLPYRDIIDDTDHKFHGVNGFLIGKAEKISDWTLQDFYAVMVRCTKTHSLKGIRPLKGCGFVWLGVLNHMPVLWMHGSYWLNSPITGREANEWQTLLPERKDFRSPLESTGDDTIELKIRAGDPIIHMRNAIWCELQDFPPYMIKALVECFRAEGHLVGGCTASIVTSTAPNKPLVAHAPLVVQAPPEFDPITEEGCLSLIRVCAPSAFKDPYTYMTRFFNKLEAHRKPCEKGYWPSRDKIVEHLQDLYILIRTADEGGRKTPADQSEILGFCMVGNLPGNDNTAGTLRSVYMLDTFEREKGNGRAIVRMLAQTWGITNIIATNVSKESAGFWRKILAT